MIFVVAVVLVGTAPWRALGALSFRRICPGFLPLLASVTSVQGPRRMAQEMSVQAAARIFDTSRVFSARPCGCDLPECPYVSDMPRPKKRPTAALCICARLCAGITTADTAQRGRGQPGRGNANRFARMPILAKTNSHGNCT